MYKNQNNQKGVDDDRKVEVHWQKNYVENCIKKYTPRPIVERCKETRSQLINWSYLPNAISVLTFSFFAYYLLSDYPDNVKIVLGLIFVSVGISAEIGKRKLIEIIGQQNYTKGKKVSLLFCVGLIVLVCGSMFTSFTGGDKFVHKTAPLPQKEISPKIDSLNNLINKEDEKIESARNTTWKGRIVEDARQIMLLAEETKKRLNSEINQVRENDDTSYAAILSVHNSKTFSLGRFNGTIAAMCDLILIALLFKVEELDAKVAIVEVDENPSLSHKSTSSPGSLATSLLATKPATPTAVIPVNPSASSKQKKSSYGRRTAKKPTSNQDVAPTPDGLTLTAPEDGELPTPEFNAAQPVGSLLLCPNDGKQFLKTVHNKKFCCSTCKGQYWEKTNARQLPDHMNKV